MARAIERIDRDIALLKEAIKAIAAELESAYANYLGILGQAVRQQLILATYHLCTQGYPEKFLKLSLNQRQQLQQTIRKLGQQAAEQLLTFINNEEHQDAVTEVTEVTGEYVGDEVVDLAEEDGGNQGDLDDETDVDDEGYVDDEGDVDDDKNPQPKISLEKLVMEGNLSGTVVGTTGETPTESLHKSGNPPKQLSAASDWLKFPQMIKFTDPSNPMELAAWQKSLEKLIQHTLKKASHDANVLLQKISILPKKLPQPILEVAAAASEASGEVIPGPPNLLNLVIEIENEQDAEESGLTRLMAINLRLSEIEFADPKLSSARKQIRNILIQLNKLGQDYQKKQRERSIAEAEAAWRAIWNDD
ncbi:MAG: hypothetical protein RMX68_025485 [Aulosira sp. ZfuVER01]|nr:hypothetical protein [Aulosira sp. ZfuVER01]MDZ8001775.1 hypothetical protein [Aulosira sp. DedVER01a]MDZ8053250.1 hypothetical protein [Aulosira sp. ZfuCHP01]